MKEISSALKEPDILEVIADLSNAEVRTPPKVANAILDGLPIEVWSNPELRWLDPGCKTGVFLREAAKRLITGLEEEIPDSGSRVEHILKNMIFGIATTEISSLMTRRSLYGSKDASGEFSMAKLSNSDGNIWFEHVEHKFKNGRCSECRASAEQWGNRKTENHAYGFIHKDGFETIGKEMRMKFDVIVGNPPYQMAGGGGGTNDTPLYDVFVEQAIALNPKFISMIIPSRWMAGGRGLDKFRLEMLTDKRIRSIVDYPNANDVFPGPEIKGGVCYFLWNREESGKCNVTLVRGQVSHGPIQRELDEFDVFVRDSRALSILRKVRKLNEPTLEQIISGDTPFGLASNHRPIRQGTKEAGEIKLYANQGGRRIEAWIKRDAITKNVGLIDAWKVLIPEAGSDGGQRLPDIVLGKPLIAMPASVCTQTYLVAGPVTNAQEAENLSLYFTTRFVRFLISLRKISQHALRSTYSWVPQQNLGKTWTDKELFKKYGITSDEQAYIKTMVKEMPL